MKGLEPREFYERYEDMSPDGYLRVLIEDDGDVIVSVVNERAMASVQFCTLAGGGKSLKVRAALLDLARAIKDENETEPQSRGAVR